MKHFRIFLPFVAAILFFTSCDGGGGFFSASGTTNEVMVLIDDTAWESTAGIALFNVLNSNAKALPQPEPNFRILQIVPENFSSTFKMARNIIIPEISNIYSYPKLTADIDKYAVGQVIMNIHAPDTATFVKFVTENKESIVDYFVTKELERNGKYLKNLTDPVTRINQVFGVNIHFPKGLSNVTEHKNFYWATNNAPRSRQDIVIYQFPYTTEAVFEKDSLINIRNRVLGEYIKGSFDSEMTTAIHSYMPDYRRIEVESIFRAELRGLWEMTTDMMGGPFVMQAFVNENSGMVVVVETFIYAPETTKRNLMRNLESTLYTISIPEVKKRS
ncbi:MAG: DUF4837 family protein [Proteiniphilum sp.]|nr:DUF4837 family protein [Proteiniphilum sp.]MDD3909491.1 DUF4837 family protein [Proteiniphilum sp.]MDD4416326.1 DUF4837 family protein [Proteiniphilum sp.]